MRRVVCQALAMTSAVEREDWRPDDTLAARFLLVRTQLGKDRKAFAAMTGLTENQLQSIESGRSPRDLATKVHQVHLVTGVDREWLMWGGPLRDRGSNAAGGRVLTSRHRSAETGRSREKLLQLDSNQQPFDKRFRGMPGERSTGLRLAPAGPADNRPRGRAPGSRRPRPRPPVAVM